MSAPVRVLIVDDSAVVRQLLTTLLSADPEIEVVGTALPCSLRSGPTRWSSTRPGDRSDGAGKDPQ